MRAPAASCSARRSATRLRRGPSRDRSGGRHPGRYSFHGSARPGGASVRVRTSRAILLWLALIFLGGMVVLALAGDASARRELPAQFATWAFIGLLFFLGWWF